MNEQSRHVAVMGIAVLVIIIGASVGLIAVIHGNCDDKIFLVATGIVAVASSIIAGEFGLSRTTNQPSQAVKVDHPVTNINQGADGKQ